MILSDRDIRAALFCQDIIIDPQPADDAIQPASVDVHIAESGVLAPGEFRLLSTREVIGVHPSLAAQLMGVSTVARRGLIIESAGFIDPGFGWSEDPKEPRKRLSSLTLEVKNIGSEPYEFTAGDRIGQIRFDELKTEAERPYGHPDLGSKYQGQRGPTEAR